uniref:Spermatogenesis-associated protein 2 PUB-like domain-containing protein n=1 Tax=Takifugu rubripes TaxID=31033 RepID=A0A3B5KM50_TAKRU
MSISRWRATDLAEDLLRDGDAQDIHCLDLDPLLVMEESLKASATDPGRAKAKGGLQGLAKAFEVVEQAALNLYLGPWRREYKFVKMYSGTFTHFIKPVLSTSQIEKLFGLLGYQLSSRHEQLRLQPSRVGPASLDDLVRLSCALFLARCECRLLLAALGKHVGEAQWELSVVRERQKGNSLQVALDNTKKKLQVSEPLFEGEEEVDLYTDEHLNGRQRARKEERRATQSGAPSPAVKAHSNGAASPSSGASHAAAPAREDVHVSTFNCQLTKMSLLEQDVANSARVKEGKPPREESTFSKDDAQSQSQQVEPAGFGESLAEAHAFCSCLQSPEVSLKLCIECNTLHDVACALLQDCIVQSHCIALPDPTDRATAQSNAAAPAAGGDDSAPISPPLKPTPFHHCCDLSQLDPQLLCLTCGVFHSRSCRETDLCQKRHQIKRLGVCPCGSTCSRDPLVLCHYCGNEYCRPCWFRSPVVCTCGQTLNQSPV